MGPVRSETERIARTWLAKSGKRWRPFLTGCVVQTLGNRFNEPMPKNLHKLLVAVESFHKASLIHDDIEDGDLERYGEKTLHAEYGVPVAVNAGDFLVGEGYRLIGELEVSAEIKASMLQVAAKGHHTLCMGQGAELCWLRDRKPLSSEDVLSIFRQKTAPAFEVALHVGALFAKADRDLVQVIHEYSDALGVAYQIRDDLSDSGLESGSGLSDPADLGPSLLLALAHERAGKEDQKKIESFWLREPSEYKDELGRILKGLNVVEQARTLLAGHRKQAVEAVSKVHNLNLKIALHRILGKIFSDHTMMGCCNDHQAGNVPRGQAGKTSSE
jgi:geranylgeranyl pyrophosphate synthase